MKTIKELKQDGILKNHNIPTYQQVQELFESGEKRVGVVQATGTGKSYLAMQWLFDNVFSQPNQHALVLDPLKGIVKQFKELSEKIAREKGISPYDMPILFSRYDQLKTLSDEDLRLLDFDYIVLDEFHNLGAEGRGSVTQKLLEANPEAKILGMTATPIRYLDQNRDMGEELFGDNIVRGVNLREAIEQHILPEPDYVMAVYSYADTISTIEEKIKRVKDKTQRELFEKELAKAKQRAETAEGLSEVFARKIQNKNGKFIAFCPDLARMESLAEEIKTGLMAGVNQKVKIYKISYKDSNDKSNKIIKQFEEDKSDCLKIMLAVDMFNEGIHVKDVDGCFMFRPTISPRIYTQQLGRVLNVREDPNFQPVVFDVVNNIQCLDKIKQAFADDDRGSSGYFSGVEDFADLPFKIDGNDLELNEFLGKLDNVVSEQLITTEQWLACAERYVKEFGDLNVRADYIEEKTELKFGAWIRRKISDYNNDNSSVNPEIVEKLVSLDPNVFKYSLKNQVEQRNDKIIKYAKIYFAKYGHLAVKEGNNAIDRSTNEPINPFLYSQICEIRKFLNRDKASNRKGSKYPQELIDTLIQIDPRVFEPNYVINLDRELKEQQILRCAEIYFQKNGNLAIGRAGSERAEKQGSIIQDPKTGEYVDFAYLMDTVKYFVSSCGKKYYYSEKFISALKEIDSRVFEERYFENLQREKKEEKILKFATKFKAKNGHLAVPSADKFEHKNIVIDEESGESFDLGNELKCIRLFIRKQQSVAVYSDELIKKLEDLDPRVFEFDYIGKLFREKRDAQILRCAKVYFDKHGNLAVRSNDSEKRNLIYDEPTGETIDLADKLMQIRMARKGKNNNGIFSEELCDGLTQLDSRVFEPNYAKNFRKENREAAE